eukprot:365990-Chlamydomonas_euryale.AAC.28
MTAHGSAMPAASSAAGARGQPSSASENGASNKKDAAVINPNMLRLSTLSPSFFSISFFDSTLRDWNVRLEPIAVRKPSQLNDTSAIDARATPPTIGTSVASTAKDGTSPRKSADSTTEKNGSIALIVWVNETATAPSDMLVSRLPSVCTPPSRNTDLSCGFGTSV